MVDQDLNTSVYSDHSNTSDLNATMQEDFDGPETLPTFGLTAQQSSDQRVSEVTQRTEEQKALQLKMLVDEINNMIRDNCKENDLVRLIS